jgi:hypothetical protein
LVKAADLSRVANPGTAAPACAAAGGSAGGLSFDHPPCKGRPFGGAVESVLGNHEANWDMMSELSCAMAANEAARHAFASALRDH